MIKENPDIVPGDFKIPFCVHHATHRLGFDPYPIVTGPLNQDFVFSPVLNVPFCFFLRDIEDTLQFLVGCIECHSGCLIRVVLSIEAQASEKGEDDQEGMFHGHKPVSGKTDKANLTIKESKYKITFKR